MTSLGGVPQGFDRGNITLEAMKNVQKDETAELRAEQQTSKDALAAGLKEAVNPFAAALRKRPTKPSKSRIQKAMESKDKGEGIPVQRFKDVAEQFEGKNPELKSSKLVELREKIKPGDKKEEILKKIKDLFPDVSLADEALEYLLETTDGELHLQVKEALEEFRAENSREIKAGKNISEEARAAAKTGLGTPDSMRDLYRDITANPRDSATLFDQLSQKYDFKDLTKVTTFLFNSLGRDMKSKGPSIPRGELHRLITETRSLQAILGVYRFFNGRTNLTNGMFERAGSSKPPGVNFESLSKGFMSLVSERYPSSDKVLQQAEKMGCTDPEQKIIVLTQFRDAIKEVAVNQIYRSVGHRDELYMAIIEALEDLEDQLEDLVTPDNEMDIEPSFEKSDKVENNFDINK